MNNIKKVGFGEYSSDFTKNGMVYDPTDDFLKISGYTREDIESGKISLYDFIPKEQQEEYKKIVSEWKITNNIKLYKPGKSYSK